MLCSINCPRKLKCNPISNVISEISFVCVGYHNEQNKQYPDDKFRHCFKSEDSDTMNDYDVYDMKSVISVLAEAILKEEIEIHETDSI